jgi:hypothetical protein
MPMTLILAKRPTSGLTKAIIYFLMGQISEAGLFYLDQK